MTFPAGFIWGAATSAYQIEGGTDQHGRGDSIWDVYCRTPGRIKHGDTGDRACDHVAKYREDVAIMKDLGLRAYRFSIAWPRVIPGGVGDHSEAGLDFYDRLVDELLGAGITPYVTLFHWDYPLPLYRRGGWMNPSSASWFAEYTRVVVDRLSDRVGHWMTHNEPQVFVHQGHSNATVAPGLTLPPPEIAHIVHNVLRAHGMAVSCIRERAQTRPSIGWATVGVISSPVRQDPEEIEAARLRTFALEQLDAWSNSWFNDPALLGRYPEGILPLLDRELPAGWERDLEVIHQPMDFVGLNLYQCARITLGKDGAATPALPAIGRARTAIGWDLTPEVLYWGPRFYFDRYRLPIMITENGMSNLDWVGLDGQVRDPQRIDYTTRHLRQLLRAIRDGVNVTGYFHWSLLDNFEWTEGYEQRFGLVHVDFATQQRILKDSAHWYRDLIRANGASLGSPEGAPSAAQLAADGRQRPRA